MSGGDVRWKLAVCGTCARRRMMPADSAWCPGCERERHATTLSVEDIRWIVTYREPASFVRAAWMLATPSTNAATGLDLRTGAVTVHRWGAGEELSPGETEDVLILAVCPASRKAELPGLLAAEGLLSEEAAEELAAEVVVKSALGDGGERFWQNVGRQFREMQGAYGPASEEEVGP